VQFAGGDGFVDVPSPSGADDGDMDRWVGERPRNGELRDRTTELFGSEAFQVSYLLEIVANCLALERRVRAAPVVGGERCS
jgi:hypothetical protein